MATRAFRLCTQADIDAVREHAAEAVEAWAREWVTSTPVPELQVDARAPIAAALGPLDDGAEWLRRDGAGGTIWARSEEAQGVAALLFMRAGAGPIAAGGLAANVGKQALAALLQRMAAAPDQPGGEPARTLSAPSCLVEPGRAALAVRIDCAGAALQLFVEPPVRSERRATGRKLEPLASTRSALATHAVTIDARLGDIELELGALRTLAVGDVLRLSKRLDQGADLCVGGQRLPCVGYLAVVDGHVAVEIARH